MGALLLAIAAYLFWVRGTTAGWRGRVAIARRRFTRPVALLLDSGRGPQVEPHSVTVTFTSSRVTRQVPA